MEPQAFVAKARESKLDYRTITHRYDEAIPITEGGVHYLPADILNQSKAGICTSISTIQNAQKALGLQFSEDFQYLLQKKFYDGDWDEGSSILSALKVATKYGFLPRDQWTYTTQDDRKEYATYVAKLQSIPDSEIQRLIFLCTSKLTGYAQVDISNAQSVGQAILNSKAGILCRYTVGNEWWTASDGRISWSSADIDPLRPPQNPVGGHAIIMSYFNQNNQILANTWSDAWNVQGNADIDFNNYKMTEAWIPYYDVKPQVFELPSAGSFHHTFSTNLKYGDVSDEVKQLQIALMIDGSLPLIAESDMGIYGNKTASAVINFQMKYNVAPSWLLRWLKGHYVGVLTRNKLNTIYG